MKKFIIFIFIILIASGIGGYFIFKKPARPDNSQNRELPNAFFAVHFEPRSADERGFEELKNFVQMADDFKVKLTLQFAPSWAKMILSDENKMELMRRWQTNGHEIAAHHHGATHGWEWDGYTNLSASEWQKNRQEVYSRSGQDKKAVQSLAKQNNLGEKYFGNMDDYMILLKKLAGSEKIFTMTMGPDRKTDWPEEIPYSLDNIVMLPNGDYNIGGSAIVKLKKEIYSGRNVSEIDMRFIENLNEVEKAKEEYSRAKPSDVVGVVTHIEDFARDHNTPRAWMEFINKKDPSGERNKTVAEVMEKLTSQ